MVIDLARGRNVTSRVRMYWRIQKMIQLLQERKCIDINELVKTLNIREGTLYRYRKIIKELYNINTHLHQDKLCVD